MVLWCGASDNDGDFGRVHRWDGCVLQGICGLLWACFDDRSCGDCHGTVGLPVTRRRDNHTLEPGGISPTCQGGRDSGGGDWFSVDVGMVLECLHLAGILVVSVQVALYRGMPSACCESSKGNDLFSDDDLRVGDDTDCDTHHLPYRLDGGPDNTSSVWVSIFEVKGCNPSRRGATGNRGFAI